MLAYFACFVSVHYAHAQFSCATKMATEHNKPGCSDSQSASGGSLTRVITISSEVEDLGEDASESSSRTSTGSAEPESLLSRLKAAGRCVS